MIACTVFGDVPNVGGISEASTTPSRPLVPAPMKMMRPPLRSDLGDDLDAVRDPLALLLHRRDDLAVLVDDHLDDVGDRRFVDGEADRIDGFSRQGFPLRVCRHATRPSPAPCGAAAYTTPRC